MGCWNESCMLTGLPIFEGQKCLAVILIESPYNNSGCYASNAYTPVMAIPGTYNGYGSLEDDDEKSRYGIILAQMLDVKGMAGMKGSRLIDMILPSGREAFKIDASGVTREAKQSLLVRGIFLHESVLELAKRNLLQDDYEEQDRNGRTNSMVEEAVTARNEMKNAKAEREILLAMDSTSTTVRAIMDVLSESSPNGAARNAIDSLLSHAETKMATDCLGTLLALSILLADLRQSWHIPSGSGDQEGVTWAHRELAKVYENQIEAIDSKWDDEE